MTPVESAFKFRPITLRTARPDPLKKIAEVCEILVERGAGEQDGEILLEQCVMAGNIQASRRLLDKDIRIKEVRNGSVNIQRLLERC
jgi:hypothetical protein